jgi:hypothetical protein
MASPKIQAHVDELLSWPQEQRIIKELTTGDQARDEQIYKEAVILYHKAFDEGKSIDLRSVVIALFLRAKL